jgi:hypothetical protein
MHQIFASPGLCTLCMYYVYHNIYHHRYRMPNVVYIDIITNYIFRINFRASGELLQFVKEKNTIGNLAGGDLFFRLGCYLLSST